MNYVKRKKTTERTIQLLERLEIGKPITVAEALVAKELIADLQSTLVEINVDQLAAEYNRLIELNQTNILECANWMKLNKNKLSSNYIQRQKSNYNALKGRLAIMKDVRMVLTKSSYRTEESLLWQQKRHHDAYNSFKELMKEVDENRQPDQHC